MASEFVRKVKGIRNIDILSPNITTENDLISTIDGEVYVATNKGYRKITGVETKEIKQLKTDVSNVKIQSDTNTLNISGNTDDIETNTSEIDTLKTSTDNNTSEIETLKTLTDNNTFEDTGWVPYTVIDSVEGNTVYQSEDENGFENAYRIVKNGDITRKMLRVNVRNITQGTTFASLPSDFTNHIQMAPVRTPRTYAGAIVEIRPSGSLTFQYYYKPNPNWNETDYIYGQYEWTD